MLKRETLTRAEQEAARKPELGIRTLVCVTITVGLFFVGIMYVWMLVVADVVGHPERRRVDGQHEDQQKDHQTAKVDAGEKAKIAEQPKQEESQFDQFHKELREKYNPTFQQAIAHLYELAQNGCQAPFKDCPVPFRMKRQVLEAINRENIAFDEVSFTKDDLEKLATIAELRIAGQKLAYLKANGGAKRPSDIELLKDVCREVYLYKRWSLREGIPTDEELKQLLPLGVTYVPWCHWPDAKPE